MAERLSEHDNELQKRTCSVRPSVPVHKYSSATSSGAQTTKKYQVPKSRRRKKSRRARKNGKRRLNPWGTGESYAELIARAIVAQPDSKIKLREVYQWFVDNVPYFRHNDGPEAALGWKNSVRHTLSNNKCFVRVKSEVNNEKYSWWMLDTDSRFFGRKARKLMSEASEKRETEYVIRRPTLLTTQVFPRQLQMDLERKSCKEETDLTDIPHAMSTFCYPVKQEKESVFVHKEGYIEINKPELVSKNWSNGLINQASIPFEFGPVHVKALKNMGTQTHTPTELRLFRLVLENEQLLEILRNKHAHKMQIMQLFLSGKFVPDYSKATTQLHSSSSTSDPMDAQIIQTQTAPTPEVDLARELTNDYDIFSLMLEIDYELLFSFID